MNENNLDNKITIRQIETVFDLIIKKLKNDGPSTIIINSDWYLSLDRDKLFDFDQSPQFTVGSLADDLSSLFKTIEEGEMFSYTDFDATAALLKAISHFATR